MPICPSSDYSALPQENNPSSTVDIFRSGLLVYHFFNRDKVEPGCSKVVAPVLSFAPIESLTQAFRSLSLEPCPQVTSPLAFPQKVRQIYTETTVSEKDNVKLPKENKERAQAACARAKMKLEAQGEDLNLEYDRSRGGFCVATTEAKCAFNLIEKCLVQLAHLDYLACDHAVFNELQLSEVDASQRKSKGAYEKFKRLFNACLDEMDDNLRANIADNCAFPLLRDTLTRHRRHATYLPSWNYCLIPIICKNSRHASLQQLFVAAYVGDSEKLLRCLSTPSINPLTKNRQNNFFIQVAIIRKHVECVKIALEQAVFSETTLSSFWPEISPSYYDGHPQIVLHFLNHNILPRPNDMEEVFEKILSFREHAEWHPVIKELLVRFPNLQSKIEGSNRTFIEELYFEAVHKERCEQLFCQIFTKLREPLSERIISDMKERIIVNREVKWIPFLPFDAQIHCLMILFSPPSQINDSIIELEKLAFSFKKELQLHNLHPEDMCADLIVKAYSLKKEVKKTLKNPPLDASQSDLGNLASAYRELEKVYDTIVDKHPAFYMVRCVSRKIRKKSELDKASLLVVRKFLRSWVDVQGEAENFHEIWAKDALLIRRKIAKGCSEVSQLPYTQRTLKILHGTNSAALPIIFRTGKKLQAAGKLVRQGIAPLSGELVAFDAHNAKGISTFLADTFWEQERAPLARMLDHIYGEVSRFNIAQAYSERAYQETALGKRHLLFDRQKAFEKFDNSLAIIARGKAEEQGQHFWFDFKLAIMRLKMTGNKEFMEKAAEALHKLESIKLPELECCLKIWKAAPPIEIDLSDPLLKHKDPILFASSHFPSRDFYKKSGLVSDLAGTGETIVNCDLALGKALDMVFTRSDAVPRIQQAFDRAGVKMKVLSFDAGHLLEMRQMSIGTRRLMAPPIEKLNLQQTSALLHRDVLACYATPFPRFPSFMQVKEGAEECVVIEKPFFSVKHGSNHEAYLEAVKKGEILARSIHGPMHAMRVTLFSLMCLNMCIELGLKLEVATTLLLLAAARHDTMRQDEGLDHWDERSAEALRLAAKDRYGITDRKTIDLLVWALKHKDPKEHPKGYESLLQRLVHEGDFWDIIRTFDDPKEKFDLKYSALISLDEFKGFPFEKLRDEIIQFIKHTENEALKAYLEMNSQNYFQDLVVIFEMLHEKCRFPLMMQYLRPVCLELSGTSTINKETLAKLLYL